MTDNTMESRAASLVEQARTLLVPKPRHHWSDAALILGQIVNEMAYQALGYDSLEALATNEYDLARGETRLYLKLWRLILKARDAGVPVETWRTLSKGKALLVAEALDAGGEPRVWVDKAVAAGRGDAFQHELDRYLEHQVWTTLKVRMPMEVRDLVQEACQRALPYVLEDPKADLGRWQESDTVFRCLELLAGKFLRDTPVMMVEEESL